MTATRIGLLLFFLATASSRAAIVYHDIEDIRLINFFPTVEHRLDVDGNGQADFLFKADQGDFSVEGIDGNRIAAIPSLPPDIGSIVSAYSHGESINPILHDPIEWWVPSLGGRGTLNSCTVSNELVCLGEFFPGHTDFTAYIGFQLKRGTDLHLGWIEVWIERPLPLAGGTIRSIAYEDVPNKAILAGVIPEPNLICFLMAGCSVALQLRNRAKP